MSIKPHRRHVATTGDVALADRDSYAAREIRHADDMTLRAAGFKIYMRPKAGHPLWVRAGKIFTEAEAVRIVAYEDDQHRQGDN